VVQCFTGLRPGNQHADDCKKIQQNNRSAIKNGRALTISYDMIKGLGIPQIAYRNYKFDFTNAVEFIPREEWDDVLKKERSPWQGKLYGEDQKKIDTSKKAKRTRAKKRKKARKKR